MDMTERGRKKILDGKWIWHYTLHSYSVTPFNCHSDICRRPRRNSPWLGDFSIVASLLVSIMAVKEDPFTMSVINGLPLLKRLSDVLCRGVASIGWDRFRLADPKETSFTLMSFTQALPALSSWRFCWIACCIMTSSSMEESRWFGGRSLRYLVVLRRSGQKQHVDGKRNLGQVRGSSVTSMLSEYSTMRLSHAVHRLLPKST